MNLNLYDKDLNRIALIGNRYISCLWSEGFNSVGKFTMELNDTADYRKKVRPDFYVGRSDRSTIAVIKTVQIKQNKIIASGEMASRVLDDVAFIGTIESNNLVDESIINAYNNSRGFYNLEFAESNLGIRYPSQISHKSILQLCQEMCQSTDIGFRTVRGDKKLLTEFYRPAENKNLIFAEKFGNLSLDSISLSTQNYKNYAIILGQGVGEDRFSTSVDLSENNEIRELIVDAKNLQRDEDESIVSYLFRLQEKGIEKLLEQQKTWACSFTPSSKDFGTRYDLGDILTVILFEYDLKFKARISKFTQKSQKNQTTTTVDVGDITIVR